MAKKNFNQRKIKLLIFFGVIVYAAITFLNQQSIINSQLNKQKDLQAQESQIKQEIAYNQSQLDYIGTDAYVIKEARERLGWMFQDETKYVEVPSDQPQQSGQPVQYSPARSEPAGVESVKPNHQQVQPDNRLKG